MFQSQARRTTTRTVFGMLELIYHSIVRDTQDAPQCACWAGCEYPANRDAGAHILCDFLPIRNARQRHPRRLSVIHHVRHFPVSVPHQSNFCRCWLRRAGLADDAACTHEHLYLNLRSCRFDALPTVAFAALRSVHISCGVHTSGYSTTDRRNGNAFGCLAVWGWGWNGVFITQTLGPRNRQSLGHDLHPWQHDCVRQDVRGLFIASFYVGVVRLEPAFPHN